MLSYFTGDAVWENRQQRVHAGLSVSIHRHTGVRSGSSQRYTATEMTNLNNFLQDS